MSKKSLDHFVKPTGQRAHKKMGRPEKITQEIQDLICTYILMGSYVETAVQAAGIHKTTLYRWLKKGAEDRADGVSSIYLDFCNAVETSIGRAMQRDLKNIDDAAQKGDWRASAWKLERRAPHLWGPRAALKIEDERFDETRKEEKETFEIVLVDPKPELDSENN